jgi:hypothetical protein
MAVNIHPGKVVHSMDHLVLDLATAGKTTAYFTIYSLAFMLGVGPGRVALLRVSTPDGVTDRCFGETIGLAARMQHRLRTIRSEGGAVPQVGLDTSPQRATIHRSNASQGEHWMVQSDDHFISASWSDPAPAFWLSAPAPALHPTRDYVTSMVSYQRAELTVDGSILGGVPYAHDWWQQKLGRPFSSCHAALAETAIEAE